MTGKRKSRKKSVARSHARRLSASAAVIRQIPISEESKSDAAAPRDRIMLSAMRLFAQKGLHGVGVREIARGAGVNVNLISYYFKTKEDLWN